MSAGLNKLDSKKSVPAGASQTSLPDCRSSVAILLCTMQGQHYLPEQLDSIWAQSHTSWSLWASDDGSSDGTHSILSEYQAKWGEDRISLHSGPAEGFVANFLSLTCNANITADYYAYSDQDDIWKVDKLSRALRWLQATPAEIPALYCSRTCNVDSENNIIGFSPLFTKQPCFANALVQSIGGGNTMVFNDAARRLLRMAGSNVNVASHDWWIYMVVSGCGGVVFYDPQPSLRYRQHGANLIGVPVGWREKVKRLTSIRQGRFRNWININISALHVLDAYLSPENIYLLNEFTQARNCGFFSRLRGMKRSGVHRQTLLGNFALIFAVIFNRV